MTRIALIHALAESVVPVNAEMERAWPECTRMNLIDDSLSADLAAAPGGLDERFDHRFLQLASYAVMCGADGILFTCSAFGRCIEFAAQALAPIPILKPNEAMIADAVKRGGKVGLVASFAPTLASMPREFPAGVALETALAVGALEALRAGDGAGHDALVVAAARRLAEAGCDAIALAQFSMARAAPAVEGAIGLPVLTTVGSAVRELRRRVASSGASSAEGERISPK